MRVRRVTYDGMYHRATAGPHRAKTDARFHTVRDPCQPEGCPMPNPTQADLDRPEHSVNIVWPDDIGREISADQLPVADLRDVTP